MSIKWRRFWNDQIFDSDDENDSANGENDLDDLEELINFWKNKYIDT